MPKAVNYHLEKDLVYDDPYDAFRLAMYHVQAGSEQQENNMEYLLDR
jgi:hypothetical protein